MNPVSLLPHLVYAQQAKGIYIFENTKEKVLKKNAARLKKNQLHAQLILSTFRQPLHVSGVSRPIIRRYNRMYTTFGHLDSHLKRISINCFGFSLQYYTKMHGQRNIQKCSYLVKKITTFYDTFPYN